MVMLQPYLVLMVMLHLVGVGKGWVYALVLNLSAFFVCAMVAHGELVRRRPKARDLTEFYLLMSFGGMLGGAFNALFAPYFFESVIEYPLALVLACLLRPTIKRRSASDWRLDILMPALLLAVLALPTVIPGYEMPNFGIVGNIVVLVVIATYVFSFKEHPRRFALGIGAFLVGVALLTDKGDIVAQERSFFGVHRVQMRDAGALRVLLHGTTVHGAQSTDANERRALLSYYYAGGPFGQLFAAYRNVHRDIRAGIVGLGAGALACYRRPNERWTFYEIDPVVIRIARDTANFSYLSECAPNEPIIAGDARLSLRGAPARDYDMIFLDAFSSDAIPIHLITREALALYLEKLAEGGIVVFHISNRHLNLAPMLAGLADSAGLAGRRQFHVPASIDTETLRQVPSDVVVMARNERDLAPLDASGNWTRLETLEKSTPWTDDYSNILGALRLGLPALSRNE